MGWELGLRKKIYLNLTDKNNLMSDATPPKINQALSSLGGIDPDSNFIAKFAHKIKANLEKIRKITKYEETRPPFYISTSKIIIVNYITDILNANNEMKDVVEYILRSNDYSYCHAVGSLDVSFIRIPDEIETKDAKSLGRLLSFYNIINRDMTHPLFNCMRDFEEAKEFGMDLASDLFYCFSGRSIISCFEDAFGLI